MRERFRWLPQAHCAFLVSSDRLMLPDSVLKRYECLGIYPFPCIFLLCSHAVARSHLSGSFVILYWLNLVGGLSDLSVQKAWWSLCCLFSWFLSQLCLLWFFWFLLAAKVGFGLFFFLSFFLYCSLECLFEIIFLFFFNVGAYGFLS